VQLVLVETTEPQERRVLRVRDVVLGTGGEQQERLHAPRLAAVGAPGRWT